MESTLRVRLTPIRLRFVRRLRVTLVRWLRARLREESPIIDHVAPDVSDKTALRLRGPV